MVEVHTEYIQSATREFEIHVHSVAYLNINQEAMIGTDSAKKAQILPSASLDYPRKPMEIKKKKSFYVDQNRQHGVVVVVLPTDINRQSFSLLKSANSVESVAGRIRFTQCGNNREGGMESDRKNGSKECYLERIQLEYILDRTLGGQV